MKTNDLSALMKLAHQFIRTTGKSMSEALKIAWANFKLRRSMSNGIVRFYFRKVDGTIREAWGTLSEKIIPASTNSDRKKNDTVQTYFDAERQEWRCFKKLNLVY